MRRQLLVEYAAEAGELGRSSSPESVSRVLEFGGLFFQVQGPRQVRTYALWVEAENRILFYDGTGLRFAETRLSEAPEVSRVTA